MIKNTYFWGSYGNQRVQYLEFVVNKEALLLLTPINLEVKITPFKWSENLSGYFLHVQSKQTRNKVKV